MKYEMKPQHRLYLDRDETKFLFEQLKLWDIYGKCPTIEVEDAKSKEKYYFSFGVKRVEDLKPNSTKESDTNGK